MSIALKGMKQAVLSVGAMAMLLSQFWGGSPLAAAEKSSSASPAVDDSMRAFEKDAVNRAAELAKAGNGAGAEAVVAEVRQRLGDKDPFVDELSGTVFALQKKYAEAEASFRKQLAKAPESRVGQFNLAEMFFLQTRYEEAEKRFASIESTLRETDPALADLCRYKRVVCRLALGSSKDAEALLPSTEDGPASPAVQYSRAAIRFAHRDAAGAQKALEEARNQFSVDVENLYADSLIELRWGARDESGKFVFVPVK